MRITFANPLLPLLLLLLLPSGLGAQNFGSQDTIANDLKGAHAVEAGDLDGDGDADVVAMARQTARISWYENLDQGHFAAPRRIQAGDPFSLKPEALTLADLDLDGAPAILVAAGEADLVLAYENHLATGDSIAAAKRVAVLPEASAVVAADLVGDSLPDVVAASYVLDALVLYENRGNGDFAPGDTLNAPDPDGTLPPDTAQGNADGPRSLAIADLNNDGRLDVLSASERDNKIAWYPQSSGGQFDEQRVISETALGANAVVAADLNGDGAPDVLSASKRDDKIARYSNHLTAADSFSSARPLNQPDPDGPQQGENGNANEAYDLLVSDLDADGDPDVVTASALDNKIAWHENLDSSFSSQRLISIQAFGARSIAAADLNSDGLPDVLSASFNDDKVAWYENQLNTARSRPGGASKARCRLAPNPTDGYLRFLGSALQPRQPAQLTVRSARGRVLVRRRLTALHTRLELPPGLYSLTLRQGAKRFHRKVILR